MKAFTAILSGLVAASGCTSSANFADKITGIWDSSTCEAYPAGNGTTNHVTRDFVILGTSHEWMLRATVFADSACAEPFVDEDVGGATFDVIGPSPVVSGAQEVDYTFAYRKLTPLSDAAASALNQTPMCGSNWETGVEQDLSSTGCAGFGVDTVTSCPTEHDLNKLEGTSLYFGDRSGDLCTTRPTMLVTYPVVEQ
ncbi:MAG TPA: hypothetical protein VLX92_19570 [Kofleriaceae bacterium]|nr:hypothetical protein [Kofleriaceae bacterium]